MQKESKKILVTGDKGYIGTVLVNELLDRNYEVTGIDAGYFSDCKLDTTRDNYKAITKDIRDLDINDIKGHDYIIHLAGLSNDPLGEFDEILTEDINYRSTLELAKLAKSQGIKRFVYASSQSMYGISKTGEELDEDNSEKNPVTAYAKTKWEAECKLKELNDDDFCVTCFRPSTVFGASPRLRCDIVFNNFVACAYTTGKIEIKSDGSPWRPVIHVKDVCSAFIAGIEAPSNIVSGRSYNVGIENGNYTVKELAKAAQNAVKGSKLTFTGEHGADSRTYRVGFTRILRELKDYYKPKWDLKSGAEELVEFFKKVDLTEDDFRGEKTIRLKKLKKLIQDGKLNNQLKKVSN